MPPLCRINVTKFVREIHQVHMFTLKTHALSTIITKINNENITYTPATNEIGYEVQRRYIWCSLTLSFFKG